MDDRDIRPGRRIRYAKPGPAAISDRRSLPADEIFSVDIIYGRNITGENANWITIGTTIRFPCRTANPRASVLAIYELSFEKIAGRERGR